MTKVIEHNVANDDFTRAVPEGGTLETARAGRGVNVLLQKVRTVIADVRASSHEVAAAA